MALDGHLRKYTMSYPEDSAHDDECMVHVIASRDDLDEDAHVLALLKGCCEAGIILWRRHCSEYLEPDDSAKVPTETEIKRESMCDANNDVCESNLSLACKVHADYHTAPPWVHARSHVHAETKQADQCTQGRTAWPYRHCFQSGTSTCKDTKATGIFHVDTLH